MKKLIVLLGTYCLLTTVSSQTDLGKSMPIVTYKINADNGYSKNLQLPNPHYVSINSLTAEVDILKGFVLHSHIITSTDSVAQIKFINDSIPEYKIYILNELNVDTLTFGSLIGCVKNDLENIYGVDNVIKLEN